MSQVPITSTQQPVLIARGSFSGARTGSFSRSTSTYRSTSTSRSTTSKTTTTRPGSTIKTSDGRTVKSSTTRPANRTYSQSRGIVGDNGYQPRFINGYSAPAGSVVYYPQHDFFDYLPWIYLFSHDSPRNDAVTVVQPDGKQVQAKPEEGFDGLVVFNWIVLVVLALAAIAGVVWLVNKLTARRS